MKPRSENSTELELVQKIQNELGVDERTATELYYGLNDALGYHNDVGSMYCSEITIKDYKKQIMAAHDAVSKLNVALRQIPENDRKVLDGYYCEANEQDMLMFESGFQEISQRMEKTLVLAENNINKPGAGKASRTGKEYIAAIEMLMRWFSDACPEYKLSASQNTPFYKYVQIWFECFVNPDDNDKDIRRHIENSLNHPNVRRHHAKGQK